MHGGRVAERGRERGDVAFDDDVELARLAAQQQVADGAADEVNAVQPARRLEQPRSTGEHPHGVQQIWHRRRHRHSLAALPAPADRAAAIPTMAGVIPSPRRVQALARLALGVVVFVLVSAPLVLGREGDVSNSDVAFVETTETTPATAVARAGTSSHPADDRFEWPVYGYSKARTHHLPLAAAPRPPYHQAWAYRGRVLLEFAPVLCKRKIFLLKNNAALYALSRATGKPRWKRKLGELAAASPACSHGVGVRRDPRAHARHRRAVASSR